MSDAPLAPFDPVANAIEQLKRLPDELTFEVAESYTTGLEWHELHERLNALHRLDAACREAGYTIRISAAPGGMAHRYALKRKSPTTSVPPQPIDDAIDL